MTDKVQQLEKLRKKYGDEEVLVCHKTSAFDVKDKFSVAKKDVYTNLARTGRFIKRYDAEYNPVYLQLIGYVVITDLSENLFFVSRRKAGEERLKGKWSFFGGHTNPCDMGLDTVMNAAIRELNEEVDCDVCGPLQYRGLVRDDLGPTPEHLGVVFQASVNKATIKETNNLEGKWMNKKELFTHYKDFEAWGQYIIDHIYEEHTSLSEGRTGITQDSDTNVYTLAISNSSGTALPATGGPGTRLSTILGSILVAGAGLMLWRKRRFV